ncbi:MAG: GTP-binding protein TypA [Candidatus Magasanikbacteria bacterium GW2011_GWA2_45_39]|uniref:Large ribosomal subunit assembly factor BipA n=2 Tax=Candidatus Magasanikiibacteriota TaxID=1752731 RepID=A0A0G1N0X3_9BACT|nr:MAG: GTP-binding protein TypA [Candidatus Magasanikbacteria bacterium GW2011_GWA2_45_39]KKU14124.1 MAG: GTP-binding protein TypA [Candidatus Magasanikbacteria bacterium GW2011_GWC2_45_8]HBW73905.1 translational GTPase TypA [Candidatus Magasanikbacteria bacterium]
MNIRNVAIIAHVDHGKTTLVDALIRQSEAHMKTAELQRDLIMDFNDLERERGITIFSKNAAINWHDTKINIIDTPGHADFGGEVERVLKMADGALLLVDAKEGPMPQTRFVLKKALAARLKVIVVVNKVDKPDARPNFAVDKTFDLFVELGANDEQLNFPIVYASAVNGKAGYAPDLEKMIDIQPIFEEIVKHVPAPVFDLAGPLQMLIVSLSPDDFKGRIATGRVFRGSIKAGQTVAYIKRDGAIEKLRITSLMTYQGLQRMDVQEAQAGDVVAVAGIGNAEIGGTLADVDAPEVLPILEIEKPTVKITLSVNSSPFAGKEGKYTTSRQIRERLFKELETDVALHVEDNPAGDAWIVSGRGELHLAILIERLRREGYEFQVSRPQVITRVLDGEVKTPWEQVFIEVPEVHSGAVIQKMGTRRAELREMHTDASITHLEFLIPTRGLFGYRSEFLTDTKGLGIMNTLFYGYREEVEYAERGFGSLVAHETGTSALYGLLGVQDRGQLFIGHAVEVYKGQVVGQNAREGDISVNVCKTKQLSNMRSKGDGSAEHFKQPRTMDLEDALEYIADDELVEVTPQTIRIRKKILDVNQAKREAKGMV